MRAQLAVLLALAAVLSGGVSTTNMTKASVMVHRNDAPTKQLFRSDATSRINDDDYGEERNGLVEGMTKIFQQSFSLTRKFKNVEVNKLKLEDVEKLFTSEKYQGWVSDIIRWNDNKNRYTSSLNVNKLFNEELGPEKAFKVFNIASTSANPAVKRKGDRFQLQLLRQLDKDVDDYTIISGIVGGDEAAAKLFDLGVRSPYAYDVYLSTWFAHPLLKKWATQGRTEGEVMKIAPSLGNQYTEIINSLILSVNRQRLKKSKRKPVAVSDIQV